jgi:hypothetical protein
MDQARLTAIREWNDTLKHDTDQPYRQLVRAHLLIEDMLGEIAQVAAERDAALGDAARLRTALSEIGAAATEALNDQGVTTWGEGNDPMLGILDIVQTALKQFTRRPVERRT